MSQSSKYQALKEALQESEEKYRTMVELAHDGIALTEGSVRVISFANQRFAEMLGYSVEELVGRSYVDLIFPEHMEQYLQERREVFTSGKPSIFDTRLVRKDGSTLRALISVSPTNPMNLTESAPAISVFTDITEQKRMEEELGKQTEHLEELVEERAKELRESEDRLRILFEHAPDAYYLNDLKGNFVDGNKAAEELTGYKREELIGRNFLKLRLLPPNEIPKAAATLAKNVIGQPTGPDEFTLNRKDGSQVSVEIKTFPVKVAGQILVLGIARDITERKRMEEELRRYSNRLEELVEEKTGQLRESEERFRGITERSFDGIFTVDLEGRFTYVSPAVERITGYKPEEMVGKRLHNFFSEQQASKIVQAMAEMVGAGAIEGFEAKGSRKDGSQTIVEVNASTIIREGKLVGIQGIMRDITQRKMMEDREQFLHSLLRHDLGNKLQGLYGYLDLLRRTDPSEKQKEYLSHMRTSLQGAGDLIARIRELRAVEEDKEITTVNLDLAIRTAIRAFPAQEKILYRGVPDAMVVASTLLRTVFTNLIENSIRHSLCTEITITVQELKDRYKVTVQDNGRGIPEVVRRSLFGRGVKSGDTSGTGLGLYLVKRIIDASKGTIQLKDTKKGTRFDIYLKKAEG